MRIPLFLAILLFFISVSPAYGFMGLFGQHETVTADNGYITLDTSTLANEQAKHYQYKENGTSIRFFLVRDSEGVIRAALDACDVCWRSDKGYQLQEGTMVCVNCGMRFALSRIGQAKGGCNPHPITYTLQGNTFSIAAQELLNGAGYFPGNSK